MVLVTGGTGFIGSHLVETLCAQGEAVRCLIRRSSRKYLSQPPAEAELVYGDLLSGAGLDEALEGVDTLFYKSGKPRILGGEIERGINSAMFGLGAHRLS